MAKFTNRIHWEATVLAIWPSAQISKSYHGAVATLRISGRGYSVGNWDSTAPGMRSVEGVDEFAQGEQANADGELLSANPHAANAIKFLAWANGFKSFQITRDEWEQGNHERAIAAINL